MRTKAQIDNLRAILFRVSPLAGTILSDSMVNSFGNMIQEQILAQSPLNWLIKIRTEEDGDKSWEDISYEPKRPCCTYKGIADSCFRLIMKYPKIIAIQIAKVGNPYDTCIYDRDKIQEIISRQKHVL